MPAALTYPGVYIEELPSGVRTITGVATSITAFIGSALRGPTDEPVRVQSFAEFERKFGGLWVESTLGYAVAQFFLNGGGDALIVRVASAAAAASASVGNLYLKAATTGTGGNALRVEVAQASGQDATHPNLFKIIVRDASQNDAIVGTADDLNLAALPNVVTQLALTPIRLVTPDAAHPLPMPRPANTGGPIPLTGGNSVSEASNALGLLPLIAASSGSWGNDVENTIELVAGGTTFNLTVKDLASGATEKFLNLSVDPGNARFVTTVLQQGSKLVRISSSAVLPFPQPTAGTWKLAGGTDGAPIGDNDISLSTLEGAKRGLWALEKADLFNLLCIPPPTFGTDVNANTRTQAATYCKKRRALYIVDPLMAWNGPAAVIGNSPATGIDGTTFGLARSENAALFFPFIVSPDPLQENRLETFAPCGAVAGVMARTDTNRGVWKAPAGIEATLAGASALSVKLTDGENGQLNPIGVNCLRSFPVIGRVVWGARTMRGADQLADQWKYIPVRRLALYIEESLFRGTQWVVFEPNDEPLWSQIRLNIGSFMNTLFRQGAFQGASPKEAYFVKCSHETTTQTDIDNGIVNIIVGFAPLKPAEFVVIKIQQIAGQTES
jgi:Bacteriophage tail sheath protein